MVRALMLDHDKRGYRAIRRGEPSKQGARPATEPDFGFYPQLRLSLSKLTVMSPFPL